MMHRYFLVEPLYTDIDTFCSFTVGSGRVRANIQIYANHDMLAQVAWALTAAELPEEFPKHDMGDAIFDFGVSVLPRGNGGRTVRFRVFQLDPDDGAPFTADIRFDVSAREAEEFARDLEKWLETMGHPLEWKP